MKKIILILFLLISFKEAYCQRLTANSVNRAHLNSYVTKITGSSQHNLSINNTSNVLQNKKPKSTSEVNYFEKNDKTALLKIFNRVFSHERINQLAPENGIFINFYVNPQGKVLEISFLLKSTTLITAAEIETLEKEIKDNITFKVAQKATKADDFLVYSEFVKYKKVLDGTLE